MGRKFWPNFLQRPGAVRPLQKVWAFLFEAFLAKCCSRERLEQKNSVYKGKCEVLNNIPVLYIVAFKKDSKTNLDKCFKSSLINFGKYYIYKNEK